MLFHSWPFALFFIVVFAVYFCLSRTRFWLHWLLIASYVFYGWWNPLYLLLIVYSTLLDYAVVVAMDRSTRKKLWLAISLANNLVLLGFFKYAGFVTENVNCLLGLAGSTYVVPAPGILLPVGISFYTFQSMSYTIDFYRGEVERERSFVRFAAFVALFPQLVAGPIERSSQLLPQLKQFPGITTRGFAGGASLFVVGLFKKVALADYLALYVDGIYASPGAASGSELLAATFAFAWQIYFDFSGYTDMARGVALAMGIRLMQNFNNPYLATGLGDFWSRWHISLSTWFRDYVYVPLGGNRHGAMRTYRNLLLTMVISGLWHGANWTFVIWGALHGVGTMITRRAERSDWYRERVPKFLKQFLVFAFVCFAWIFFRAENLDDALLIVTEICTSSWSDANFPLLALSLIAAVWVYQFVYESRLRRWLERSAVRVAAAVILILYLLTVPGTGGGDDAFIYFQF